MHEKLGQQHSDHGALNQTACNTHGVANTDLFRAVQGRVRAHIAAQLG
jgi:hypothetical protein